MNAKGPLATELALTGLTKAELLGLLSMAAKINVEQGMCQALKRASMNAALCSVTLMEKLHEEFHIEWILNDDGFLTSMDPPDTKFGQAQRRTRLRVLARLLR